VSNPSERGTGGRAPKAPRAGENFRISYIKMVSFYAYPVIFIDTVTANATRENPRIYIATNQQ